MAGLITNAFHIVEMFQMLQQSIPASTTACASSGVCLAMSLRADAATRFKPVSGSCTHNTNSTTAPASTTYTQHCLSAKQWRQSTVHDSNHRCTTPSIVSGYKVLSCGQVCADQMKGVKIRPDKSTRGLVRRARQSHGVDVQRCAGLKTVFG